MISEDPHDPDDPDDPDNPNKHYQATVAELPMDVRCEQYMHRFVFMVPSFLRINCCELVANNAKQGTARVNLIIILTVWYGQLPVELVQQLEKAIRLDINSSTHLNLVPEQFISDPSMSLKVDNVQQMKQLCYVIRGVFEVDMQTNAVQFPFEELLLKIKIGVGANKCKFLGKDAYIYFNNQAYMQQEEIPVNYGDLSDLDIFHQKVDHLRMFNLSKFEDKAFALDFASTRCIITKGQDKQEIPREEEAQILNNQGLLKRHLELIRLQPKYCQFMDELKPLHRLNHIAYSKAQFQMKLIRYPLQLFLTIAYPVIFLSLISLAMFFQENTLSTRIASILTVMIALSTYLPTIRERTPEGHGFTMMELSVYSAMWNGFMCFLRTLLSNSNKKTKYNCWSDPLFLSCIVLQLMIFVVNCWMFWKNEMKMLAIKKHPMYRKNHSAVQTRYGYRVPLVEMKFWQNPEQKKDEKNLPIKYSELFKNNDLFMRMWIKRFEMYIGENPIAGGLEDIKWDLKLNISPYYRQAFAVLSQYFKIIVTFEQNFTYALIKCLTVKGYDNIKSSLKADGLGYLEAKDKFISAFLNLTQVGTISHEFNIVELKQESPILKFKKLLQAGAFDDKVGYQVWQLAPSLTDQLVREVIVNPNPHNKQ